MAPSMTAEFLALEGGETIATREGENEADDEWAKTN